MAEEGTRVVGGGCRYGWPLRITSEWGMAVDC